MVYHEREGERARARERQNEKDAQIHRQTYRQIDRQQVGGTKSTMWMMRNTFCRPWCARIPKRLCEDCGYFVLLKKLKILDTQKKTGHRQQIISNVAARPGVREYFGLP